MNVTIVVLLLFLSFAAMTEAGGDVLLRDDFSSDSLARYEHPPVWDIFERVDEPATWEVRDGKLIGDGTFAPWSYQLRGEDSWADYSLCATMTIERAQEPDRNYKPQVYDFYQTQARDYFDELAPGYEAALVARHGGEKQFYRLQFSTRWQEVALWEPTAGYLFVAPCKLETGRTYEVRWHLHGNHIQAWVDDAKVIDVWDRLKPFRAGKVGVGVYDARVSFDQLRVESLAADAARDPGYRPYFQVKKWHHTSRDARSAVALPLDNSDWIFDGNEPVARITDTWVLSLDRAKLRPGCWPLMYTWLYWDMHPYFKHCGELTACRVIKQGGPELQMYFETRHPQADATNRRHMTLSYDAALDSYVWYFDCVAEFGPNCPKKPPAELQVTDPFVANCCAAPKGVKRPWQAAWEWLLLTGPGKRLYKNPLHHDQPYFLAERKVIAEGGFSAFVLNEMLNPAWEMIENPDGLVLEQASCNWAYDHHLYYLFPKDYELKPGTRLRSVFRLVNYSFPKAKELFERATLHPQYDLSDEETKRRIQKAAALEAGPPRWEFLVNTIDRNDFDKTYTIEQPHAEYMIKGNYAIDRSVGHRDSCSMRLDGPGYALLEPWGGPSYYGDAFKADNYALSVWVKTKDVKGTGPVVRLSNRHKGKENRSVELVPGLTGTNDWTRLVMVTDIPKGDAGLAGVLELKGTGTAWFDELELRPLGPTEKPPEPTKGIQRHALKGNAVCDLAFTEGKGIGIFDSSGCDNHARLASGKWVESDGRAAIELDGERDYLMIQSDASMFHPEAFTVAMWINPAAELPASSALLFDQYNDLWFSLQGERAPYGLRAYLQTTQGPVSATTPGQIPAGQWTHVAFTFDSRQLILYVDGKEAVRADAKGAASFSRRANFYLGCHWASRGWYRGLLGGLTVWKEALSPARLAQHVQKGPPRGEH